MASERSSLLHGGSGGSSGAPHTLPAGGPSYAAVASGSEPAPHNHAAHDADDMERGDHDHSAHGHSHGSNGGRGGHGHSHGGHSHSAQSLRALQSSTPPRMSPRTAFAHRDAEASKRAHAAKRAAKNGSPSSGSPKEEGHNTDTGEYIKSIVYGGLDGIITTFATVTSVAGAEFTAAVVVVLGISHLFADGLSMGLGDYMSSQAEIDYTASEREREQWEMDQNMKGEIEEMIDLYVAKGVSSTDARIIIHTLAKYPEAFLDHMMVEELGLLPPVITEQGFSPAKAGAVTMCSFMCFGSVPLIPYLIALIPGVSWSPDAQLWSAIVLTLVTLFMLGAFKGHVVEIGRSAWWKSGLLMAFNGSLAATIGYLCGYIIGEWMELPPGAG